MLYTVLTCNCSEKDLCMIIFWHNFLDILFLLRQAIAFNESFCLAIKDSKMSPPFVAIPDCIIQLESPSKCLTLENVSITAKALLCRKADSEAKRPVTTLIRSS